MFNILFEVAGWIWQAFLRILLVFGVGKYVRHLRKYTFSFIGLHYMYIIGMTFAASVIMYADRKDRGLKYIDALFAGAAACTQAGLNTVDLNDTYLYQQVILYIWPFITSIITINSTVVLFRIYWFKKHIKNIEVNSKLQSRMRRTATMARAESRGKAELNSLMRWIPWYRKSHQKVLQRARTKNANEEHHQPDPSAHEATAGDTQDVGPPHDRDIRFGELPRPRRNSGSINPQDMARSISMMQRIRRQSSADGNDGPALVVKSPRDIARDYAKKSKRKILDGAYRLRRNNSSADSENTETTRDDGDDEDDDDNGNEIAVSSDEEPDSRRSMKDDRDTSSKNSASPKKADPASFHDEDYRGDVYRRLKKDRGAGYTASDSDEMKSDDQEDERSPRGPRRRFSRQPPRVFSRSFSVDRMLGRTKSNASQAKSMSTNYLSWQPTVGRNSAFVDMTDEQEEELGGVEYRALRLLMKVLACYNFLMPLLGLILMLPWTLVGRQTVKDRLNADGISPTWWTFFTVNSAFTDLGLTLTPDSMNGFKTSVYPLLVFGFFIIAGNTGFPCLLRLIIWIMFKVTPKFGRTHESLGFLLDHPRRCFTLLFPSSATWWLFFVLVVLNGVDWLFFVVLDTGKDDPVAQIPIGFRIICGLFQAIAVRTAGFTVTGLLDIHPAVKVSYMIMMYISIFPVAISMRRTNVYEEQSLGVYYDDDDMKQGDNEDLHPSYVQVHLRRQLSFDLWFVFLGLFLLCIFESGHIKNRDFTIFDLLFEIVSAYGTVGLSLGYPNYNPSLTGKFNVPGKLVIICAMIRGRHRGLPYALDRAIMLNTDALKKNDEGQARRAIRRRTLSSSTPMDTLPRFNSALTTGSVLRRDNDDIGETPESKSGNRENQQGLLHEESY